MKKSNRNNKKSYQNKKNNSSEINTQNKKKKGFWKRHPKFKLLIKILVIAILVLFVVGVGAIFAIMGSDSEWATKTEKKIESDTNTVLLANDGTEEIGRVSGLEKREAVTLDQIPKNLQNAYIAIEDERFYTHQGVDLKRTLGATVTYILHGGSSSYGGSTITQQLVKNLMKDNDDSGIAGVQRKIREISRAYNLETKLSKDQILESYLNLIFVGSDVYGVALGSKYYFNKSVTDLDLAECAFLAGINHSPNNYNPFGETDRSEKIKNRTKTVLGKMKELGYISEDEYSSAVSEVEEGIKFSKGDTATGTMSYLAMAAYEQVVSDYAEQEGISTAEAREEINGGGYKIYTTQDTKVQSTAEEVYRSGKHIFSGAAKNKDGSLVNEGHTQGAIVIMDQKKGYVVGCMGGLGDDVTSYGLNRATQAKRQPGSSIKPIAAIAPALESGIINAATIYDESNTFFGTYNPTNHGDGLITVRKAVTVSANTTEVKIMSELGPANSIEFMKKMGITSLVTSSENSAHNDENLSLVLGGVTKGITPLEMAGAYATIANDGVYIEPTFYTKVEDSNGKKILEVKQESHRVMSEGNAYILKSILTGPVSASGGTASSAKISGQETAGKTGTTNDNYDRWFCGFTNYYTAASWYGFDNQENLYYAGANYPNRALSLWKSVMADIHQGLESSSFEKPSNIVSAKICLSSGKQATDECTNTYTEYFVKGTVPDYCDGHKVVKICKETGKVANENCPEVETKVYTKKPEKEENGNWKTSDGGKYDAPTEVCDVHKEKVSVVPNLKGKTEAEAKKALEALGLVMKAETKESTDNIGKVISQDTASGTKVKQGTTVKVVIGKKKETDKKDNTSNSNTENKETNKEKNNTIAE